MKTKTCAKSDAKGARLSFAYEKSRRSVAIRRAHAEPAVTHLLVMHARIVGRGLQVEHLRRQTADRVEHRVGGDDAIVLGGDERNARDELTKFLATSKTSDEHALAVEGVKFLRGQKEARTRRARPEL